MFTQQPFRLYHIYINTDAINLSTRLRVNEEYGVTIALGRKLMVIDIKYKQILDFIIEIGSTFTVLSGIMYVSTYYFINKDWQKSIIYSIKNE